MALAPEPLDELAWDALSLAARDKMIAASRGRWTHHGPVDPGVTLTELYAWLIDQRFFWLEQVSASLKRALLGLLGGRARPARPARTIAEVRPAVADSDAGPVVIRSGDVVVHGRGDGALRFSTTHEMQWWGMGDVRLWTGVSERSDALARGHAVRLFSSEGGKMLASCPGCRQSSSSPTRDFEIELTAHVAPRIDAPVSLFLDIDAPWLVPSWSPEAEPVALPVTLRWQALDGDAWTSLDVLDGTAGLRRPGLVQFMPPSSWQQSGPFRLRVTVIEGEWTSPPRVRRIVPNAALVEHASWTELRWESLSWLPVAGHTLRLPALPERAIEVRLEMRELDGWHGWHQRDDLVFAGPGERVFTLDRAGEVLGFGDGLTGRVPRPVLDGRPNVRGWARLGGGLAGNIPSGNVMSFEENGKLFATTLVDARWGAEVERLDAALRRHGAWLNEPSRAVTIDDHKALALGESDEDDNAVGRAVALARSHAVLGFHPARRCARVPGLVTVFVVPHAPRQGTRWAQPPTADVDDAFVATPKLDRGASDMVASRLRAARMAGTEVMLLAPIYRTAHLRVVVRGEVKDPLAVRDAVVETLRRFLDPLVGGADGNGWPFGGGLRPSQLSSAAQAVLVDVVVERVAVALSDDAACCTTCGAADRAERVYEDCDETRIAPHELVTPGDIDVFFERGRP